MLERIRETEREHQQDKAPMEDIPLSGSVQIFSSSDPSMATKLFSSYGKG